MIQDPGDLIEQHADVPRPDRRIDLEQLLDRDHVGVLIAHHGHIVEAVHVADRLIERLALRELLGAAMQKPDVRVRFLNDLPVHLEHQAQHAVRCRVLRSEIHRVIAYLGH